MSYTGFLWQRLWQSALTLLGLAVIMFLVSRVIPGDPARLSLGPLATDSQVFALRHDLGLDRPLINQFGVYLAGVAHGDFGQSLVTRQAVASDLASRLPATLELVFASILLVGVIGVLLGALGARYQGSWFDTLIRIFSLLGVVAPSFFVGIALQLIFGYYLNVLPVSGQLNLDTVYSGKPTGMALLDGLVTGNGALAWDALRHLILPAFALALGDLGQLARVTRANMLDNSRKDYMRAQRSYGISGVLLTFKYLLRPSFIPSLTLLGLAFASLLGNAFLVELVFSWPGIASYASNAILQKDFNAIMGVVLIFGVFFIIASILVDLLAGVVNPRLRLMGQR